MAAYRDIVSMDRRRLLRRAVGLGVAGLAGSAAGLGGGCSESTPEPEVLGPLRVELSQLTVGSRIVIQHGELPVEIQRGDSTITARSLRCTHWGCTVQWRDQEGDYRCPCHEARFDAQGRVILGPPDAPLLDLPVTIEGDFAIVSLEA